MNSKLEKRLRRQAKQASETIQFRAEDMLNGIKESWTDEEIDGLIVWFKDKEAERWG